MAALVGRLDELKPVLEASRRENKRANTEEASLQADYEMAYAVAYLSTGDDRPTEERKQRAKVETVSLFRKWKESVALRRSSSEALSSYEKELESIAALAHLGNRELKVLGA
jgi:hypothetical protein